MYHFDLYEKISVSEEVFAVVKEQRRFSSMFNNSTKLAHRIINSANASNAAMRAAAKRYCWPGRAVWSGIVRESNGYDLDKDPHNEAILAIGLHTTSLLRRALHGKRSRTSAGQ